MKLISRVLKKSGDTQAALVGRMMYVAYLALHQLILNYVESRIEILDDESPLTIPGNPMLAQLAKQQSQGGGEVARYLGRYGSERIARAVLAAAVPPYFSSGTGSRARGELRDYGGRSGLAARLHVEHDPPLDEQALLRRHAVQD